MNDLLAPLYEMFFDWDTYQELLNIVFNNSDYGKLGIILLVAPAILLGIFYKVWDPINKQVLLYISTLIIASIALYISTSGILYSNYEMIEYIGNFTGEDGQTDANFFIIQMSIVSVLFSVILSVLYTMVFKKLSVNNTQNPF